MDPKQPSAKKQKMSQPESLPDVSKAKALKKFLPGELMNQIYNMSVFAHLKLGDTRKGYSVAKLEEGPQLYIETRDFYVDPVDKNGKCSLFANDLVFVKEMTTDLLTLVTPHILLVVRTPESLRYLVETITAHLEVCLRMPELNIELDLSNEFQAYPAFKVYGQCDQYAHGVQEGAYEIFTNWFEKTASLPATTNLYLVLPAFWRDYRSLWAIASRFGLHNRKITCSFRNDHHRSYFYPIFHLAQTISAINDIDMVEQHNISQYERDDLVENGCRGFDPRKRRGLIKQSN